MEFTVRTHLRASALVLPGHVAVIRALKPGVAASSANASSPASYSPSSERSATSTAVGHIMPFTPHLFAKAASFTRMGTSSRASDVQGVTRSGKAPRIEVSAVFKRLTAARNVQSIIWFLPKIKKLATSYSPRCAGSLPTLTAPGILCSSRNSNCRFNHFSTAADLPRRARGGASVLDNLGAIRAQLPTGAGGSPFALRFRSRRAEQRALAPPLDNLNANSTTIQPLS